MDWLKDGEDGGLRRYGRTIKDLREVGGEDVTMLFRGVMGERGYSVVQTLLI